MVYPVVDSLPGPGAPLVAPEDRIPDAGARGRGRGERGTGTASAAAGTDGVDQDPAQVAGSRRRSGPGRLCPSGRTRLPVCSGPGPAPDRCPRSTGRRCGGAPSSAPPPALRTRPDHRRPRRPGRRPPLSPPAHGGAVNTHASVRLRPQRKRLPARSDPRGSKCVARAGNGCQCDRS